VFHQSAIKAGIKGGRFDDEIKELMKRGIIVAACRNSMRSEEIKD